MSLCECGCGRVAKSRYVVGHNQKVPRIHADRECPVCGNLFRPRNGTQRFCSKPCAGRVRVMPKGRDHYRWNGGWFYSQGRLMVACRDGSQVAWYRVVMQDKLGRPLTADEVVHHLNGDHTDDHPENLQVMSQAEHVRLHRDELIAARWPTTEAMAVG